MLVYRVQYPIDLWLEPPADPSRFDHYFPGGLGTNPRDSQLSQGDLVHSISDSKETALFIHVVTHHIEGVQRTEEKEKPMITWKYKEGFVDKRALEQIGTVATDFLFVKQAFPCVENPLTLEERELLVTKAHTLLETHIPYLWGGCHAPIPFKYQSPEFTWLGVDCSGFVFVLLRQLGIFFPRDAKDQYAACTPISSDKVMNGDLVFWKDESGERITHVALLVDAATQEVIHAPKTGSFLTRCPVTKAKSSQYPPLYGSINRLPKIPILSPPSAVPLQKTN